MSRGEGPMSPPSTQMLKVSPCPPPSTLEVSPCPPPWSHPCVQVIPFHVYKWCLMCTSDRCVQVIAVRVRKWSGCPQQKAILNKVLYMGVACHQMQSNGAHVCYFSAKSNYIFLFASLGIDSDEPFPKSKEATEEKHRFFTLTLLSTEISIFLALRSAKYQGSRWWNQSWTLLAT